MKKTTKYININRKQGTVTDNHKNCNASRTALKKKRPCLKCGNKFVSEGPYNRICEKCRLVNERTAPSVYSLSGTSKDEPNPIKEGLYELN